MLVINLLACCAARGAAAAAAGGARELSTRRRLQAPGVPTPLPTEYDPNSVGQGVPTPWPTDYDPNRTPWPTVYDPFRPTEWPSTARPTTALPSLAPTLTSAPTDHEYQDNLVAYYPMTHGKLDDAHDHGTWASGFHGKAKKPEYPESDIMVAADLRQTEARDGPEGGAVALNNSKHIELPDNVTRSISGDRPRTVCLWARIDKWKNKARIFEYGRKAPQGELFGLRTWDTPGSFAILEQHPMGAYTNVTVNLTDTDRLVAQGPSPGPTLAPSLAPTPVPTSSFAPTSVPTSVPSYAPTSPDPTAVPISAPTYLPTAVPSLAPTSLPTAVPTPTLASPDSSSAKSYSYGGSYSYGHADSMTLDPTSSPTSLPSSLPTASPSAPSGYAMDDISIRTAVAAWLSDAAAAEATYGHISTWDTSGVTDMSELFEDASGFNDDIGPWDTSGVTSMVEMFQDASSFNQDIGGWSVEAVVDMEEAFQKSALDQDLGWCVNDEVHLLDAFDGTLCASTSCGILPAAALKCGGGPMSDVGIRLAVVAWLSDAAAAEATYGHISTWDTSGVSDMEDLFNSNYNSAAASFNEDISAWDTSGVTTMYMMFFEASAFDQDLGWCVDDGVFGPNARGVFFDEAFYDTPCESTSCGVKQGAGGCAPSPAPTPAPTPGALGSDGATARSVAVSLAVAGLVLLV